MIMVKLLETTIPITVFDFQDSFKSCNEIRACLSPVASTDLEISTSDLMTTSISSAETDDLISVLITYQPGPSCSKHH